MDSKVYKPSFHQYGGWVKRTPPVTITIAILTALCYGYLGFANGTGGFRDILIFVAIALSLAVVAFLIVWLTFTRTSVIVDGTSITYVGISGKKTISFANAKAKLVDYAQNILIRTPQSQATLSLFVYDQVSHKRMYINDAVFPDADIREMAVAIKAKDVSAKGVINTQQLAKTDPEFLPFNIRHSTLFTVGIAVAVVIILVIVVIIIAQFQD